MKKLGVVILILAMVLGVVASLAGCGTSKDKTNAKQYMADGDAEYEKLSKAYKDLQTEETDAVTKLMGGQTEGMDALVAQLTATGDAMRASAIAAKAQYDQILSLTGVDDYVTYANMQNDVIAMYLDLLDVGSAFMTSVFSSGQSLDVTALLASPEMQNLTQIGNDIQKQDKENKNFKSEKKLAQ